VTRVFPYRRGKLLTDKIRRSGAGVRNGLRGVASRCRTGTLDLRFMASNADLVNGDAVVSWYDGVYPPASRRGSDARRAQCQGSIRARGDDADGGVQSSPIC